MEWELDQLATLGPQIALQIAVTLICGGAIGLEREMSGKAAGLRTCILVCLGSMIFTVVSIEMAEVFGGDATRVAAQIVTGVGFLGAGAIMRETGRGITGLTTAAAIWLVSAVGMLIGSGYLLTAIVVSVTAVVFVYVLAKLEMLLMRRRAYVYTIRLTHEGDTLDQFLSLVNIYEESILEIKVDRKDGADHLVALRFAGSDNERHDFLQFVTELEGAYIRRGGKVVRTATDNALPTSDPDTLEALSVRRS